MSRNRLSQVDELITSFLQRRDRSREQLSTDQLLNALFMIVREREWMGSEKENLIDRLFAPLDRPLENKDKGRKSEPASKEK